MGPLLFLARCMFFTDYVFMASSKSLSSTKKENRSQALVMKKTTSRISIVVPRGDFHDFPCPRQLLAQPPSATTGGAMAMTLTATAWIQFALNAHAISKQITHNTDSRDITITCSMLQLYSMLQLQNAVVVAYAYKLMFKQDIICLHYSRCQHARIYNSVQAKLNYVGRSSYCSSSSTELNALY